MFLLPTLNPTASRTGTDDVTGAIRTAARATGTSFDYLLKTARRESSLDPKLTSTTSSATGLYQFIDSTWLTMVKEEGARLGYGDASAAITRSASGSYQVDDPAMRRKVMALRKDPQANALMAGAFTARNSATLTAALGRAPSEGELYIAHFLGSGGATKFLEQAKATPTASAAATFPQAARANRSIFYTRDGRPRSFAEVQSVLTAQHDTRLRTASAANAQPAVSAAVTAQTTSSQTTPAAAPTSAGTDALAYTADEPKLPFSFHGLFQGQRTAPIDANVSALWGARGLASTSGSTRIGAIGAPLDLGSFLRQSARTG